MAPIRFAPFALMGLTAAVSLVGGEPQPGDSIFTRYETLKPTLARAEAHIDAGRLMEARSLLEHLLQVLPGHHVAHFHLARLDCEAKAYAAALGHIEAAETSLQALEAKYQSVRQQAAAADEQTARAIEDSLSELESRGVDRNGCSGNLYTIKETNLQELERRKGELQQVHAAFQVPAAYWFVHGNCLFRLGRGAEALTQYRRTLEAEPRHEGAWNNLIGLHLAEGRRDAARQALKEAEAALVKVRPELRLALDSR